MKSEFNCVALLPMKAHSARVPGKNFRNFADKPLFRWILDTLISIDSIDCIVINMDARDILRSHGIETTDRLLIRDRKTELCGDMISMNRVLEDDINAIKSNTYVMTHTTNPLLSRRTIMEALELFDKERNANRCDSLFSCNKWQSRFYRADGSAINHDPNNLLRTQDLEPWYEENSNLYIFGHDSFHKTSARIGAKPLIHVTPRMESFDIDDQEG